MSQQPEDHSTADPFENPLEHIWFAAQVLEHTAADFAQADKTPDFPDPAALAASLLKNAESALQMGLLTALLGDDLDIRLHEDRAYEGFAQWEKLQPEERTTILHDNAEPIRSASFLLVSFLLRRGPERLDDAFHYFSTYMVPCMPSAAAGPDPDPRKLFSQLLVNRLTHVMADKLPPVSPETTFGMLQYAARLSPEYGAPQFHLGRALAKQGKVQEALMCFQKAWNLMEGGKPEDYATVAFCLADSYSRVKDFEKAEWYYRAAIAHFKESSGHLADDQAVVHYTFATLLQSTNRSAEAVEHYREAVTIFQMTPVTDRTVEFREELYADFGLVLMEDKQYAAAEDMLRRATGLNPERAVTLNNLGLCLAEQGKYLEAESVLRRVLELDPQNPIFLTNLAACLLEQKNRSKYPEAEELARRAMALQPAHPTVLNNVAASVLYQKKRKQYPEAETLFRRALTSEERVDDMDRETSSRVRGNLAELLLGQRGKQRLVEAFNLCREAMQSDPSSPSYVLKMAKIFNKAGRPKQAVRFARLAKIKALKAKNGPAVIKANRYIGALKHLHPELRQDAA